MQLVSISAGTFTSLIVRRMFESYHCCLKRFVLNMDSKAVSAYEEAVYALNGLQSNAETIKKSAAERSANAHLNLTNTARHLKTLDIRTDDVDSLNVIHVAGTKGKGSTCAFCEYILRNHGYKTGFYSSPHIISVNERIRINGSPLSKEQFTKYFWDVYNPIQLSLREGETVPPYFLFLTVMAFYVFVKEQVEASIVEVGVGGLYDCTNFIQKPVAVGITTLGIDHVSLLGSTITEIAMQKAGIMKKGVPCYTVPQQEAATQVLSRRAQDIGCSLFLSPPIESFEQPMSLGVQGIVQNINASLALQLTNTWLNYKKSTTSIDGYHYTVEKSLQSEDYSFILPSASTFPISSTTRKALEQCKWPGRFQILEKGRLTYFLDGAHTQQSIKHCIRWFQDASAQQRSNDSSKPLRILLFNCTGERKSETLLAPLSNIQFDFALFCPNRIHQLNDATSDLSNFMVDPETEIEQCIINREIWCHLMRSEYENSISISSASSIGLPPKLDSSASLEDMSLQFPTLSEAMDFITSVESKKCDVVNSFSDTIKKADHIQILVTGSLRLVGAVLSLID